MQIEEDSYWYRISMFHLSLKAEVSKATEIIDTRIEIRKYFASTGNAKEKMVFNEKIYVETKHNSVHYYWLLFTLHQRA